MDDGKNEAAETATQSAEASWPEHSANAKPRSAEGDASNQADAAAGELSPRWIEFDLLYLSNYHEERWSFLERWHRVLLFAVVIAGTAVFGNALGEASEWTKYIALIPASAGLIDLVFRPYETARSHHDVFNQLMITLTKFHRADVGDLGAMTDLRAEITEIRRTAPPTLYRALESMAFNAACAHFNSNVRMKVGPFRRVLRNFFTFRGKEFQRIELE